MYHFCKCLDKCFPITLHKFMQLFKLIIISFTSIIKKAQGTCLDKNVGIVWFYVVSKKKQATHS